MTAYVGDLICTDLTPDGHRFDRGVYPQVIRQLPGKSVTLNFEQVLLGEVVAAWEANDKVRVEINIPKVNLVGDRKMYLAVGGVVEEFHLGLGTGFKVITKYKPLVVSIVPLAPFPSIGELVAKEDQDGKPVA